MTRRRWPVPHTEPCWYCAGSGMITVRTPVGWRELFTCPRCQGTGNVRSTSEVTAPPGRPNED